MKIADVTKSSSIVTGLEPLIAAFLFWFFFAFMDLRNLSAADMKSYDFCCTSEMFCNNEHVT